MEETSDGDRVLSILESYTNQIADWESLAEKLRCKVVHMLDGDAKAYEELCLKLNDVLAQHSSESESRPEEDHGADLQALYNRASKLCGGPEEAQQVIFSIQKIFAAEAGLRECEADRALLVDRR